MEILDFYQYCVEVANIPYYNFLTIEEEEDLREQHESYCEKHGLLPY